MTASKLRKLLNESSSADIYHLPGSMREKLDEACSASGFAKLSVNWHDAHNLDDALTALGHDLSFPEWYGANLDALYDCLTDFSWREAPGYAITLEGAATLLAADPAAVEALNTVFSDAIAERAAQGVPLWFFYDNDLSGLPDLPRLA